jgi:hypothetical protein
MSLETNFRGAFPAAMDRNLLDKRNGSRDNERTLPELNSEVDCEITGKDYCSLDPATAEPVGSIRTRGQDMKPLSHSIWG